MSERALNPVGHVPMADGWWHLVPIWEPDQTVNPPRRYGPPEPR